jgi:hypothetical protein
VKENYLNQYDYEPKINEKSLEMISEHFRSFKKKKKKTRLKSSKKVEKILKQPLPKNILHQNVNKSPYRFIKKEII